MTTATNGTGTLTEAQAPTTPTLCETFKDAAEHLRRPFAVKALQWKVQTQWSRDGIPQGGMIVCYIDRGLVIDRLNVLVPHLWTETYEDLERGWMRCYLTVDGITRTDVGQGADLKARQSDALKRAAVHFGIGVSLARVPKSRLDTEGGKLKVRGQGDKKHLTIEQPGLDYLRDRYEQWLEQVGIATFGEPLEHGDLGDGQGDPEGDDVGPIVDEHTATDIIDALDDGTRTIRAQAGMIAAAGYTGLPSAPTKQDIAAAVAELTDEQAAKLSRLIDQAARAGS